jgi:hypothetical protein
MHGALIPAALCNSTPPPKLHAPHLSAGLIFILFIYLLFCKGKVSCLLGAAPRKKQLTNKNVKCKQNAIRG